MRTGRPRIHSPEEEDRSKVKKVVALNWYRNNKERHKETKRALYRRSPEYREKQRVCRRRWYEKNKEAFLAKSREYHKRTYPSKRAQKHASYIKRTYGLVWEDYVALIQSQKGLCALCHKSIGNMKFHVDHDHKNNKVRGLLHSRCNLVLGFLENDSGWLEQAKKYLKEHK